MRGVISAGSNLTAEIGADILAQGGNAVSAAIASCFATLCAEPAVSALGGGGIMLISNRKRKIHKCVNFFPNMPGLTLKPLHKRKHDFYPVTLNYLGTKQECYIGKGSAACGDSINALCEVAKALGNLPISTLTKKTIEQLSSGTILENSQRKLCELLNEVHMSSPQAKNIFVPDNENYRKAYKYFNKEGANFLDGLSSKYWRSFYKTHFYNKVFEQFGPSEGGLITQKDLETFKSLVQEPLMTRYKNARILLPPKPSGAGEHIASALKHLEQVISESHPEESILKYLAYTLHSLSQQKVVFPEQPLEVLAQKWLMQHFKESLNQPFKIIKEENASKSTTTHISVIDQEGTAVSVTISHGEGCGHLVRDTGIMLNNFISKQDIAPTGFDLKLSGNRVPSMISPTIMETKEGDIYAFGSGGSNRIRSTTVQMILNLIDKGKSPKEAVSDPRIHVENGVIYSESCEKKPWVQKELNTLKPLGFNHFKEKNLYFGGVNLVKQSSDGSFSGAGDQRKGGASIIVE